MKDKVLYSVDAQEQLKKGIDKVADAVKVTLGAKGKNVICVRDGMLPVVTKDGVSVAKEVQDKDPIVNAGCLVVKQVAGRVNELAGDGTSSGTVVAQAIIKEAQEALKKTNAYEIKRGIDFATEEIVKELKKLSQPTNTVKKRREIAKISANGDKEIANLVVDALSKVGKDGIIRVEEVQDTKSSIEVVQGYEFDSPLSKWGWINNHQNFTAEFDDMNVFMFSGSIESFESIVPVFQAVINEETGAVGGLLIIADNIDPYTENQLLERKAQGFKLLYVKSPSFGSRRIEVMEDMASIVGAKVVDNLQTFTVSDLGKIDKVTCGVNNTTIIGGKGNTEERIKVVKEQQKTYKGSKKDSEFIKERYSKLTSGVALIKVGGYSEPEIREKTDRVDDALKAVLCSLEEGYVAGGGTTFLIISEILKAKNFNRVGVDIMIKAIQAPFFQIYKNAEIEISEETVEFLKKAEFGTGLDIENGNIVNFFETGVVDPTKVARVALESASSIASTFLTSGAIVYNSDSIIK